MGLAAAGIAVVVVQSAASAAPPASERAPHLFRHSHRVTRHLAVQKAASAAGETAARTAGTASAAGTPVGGTWASLGPQPVANEDTYGNSAGRVTSLAAEPAGKGSVVYAGTADGGVWKSTDGGQHWSTTFDSQPTLAIGALAVDWSTNPETVYVGTGEANRCQDCLRSDGIIKSTDGGNTWNTVGNLSTVINSPYRFSGLVVDSTMASRLFAATTSGLYESDDSGQTWKQDVNGAIDAIAQDPSTTNRIWLGQSTGCSSRGVVTYWDTMADATPATAPWSGAGVSVNVERFALGIGAAGSRTIYASLAECSPNDGALLGILKTTNDGGSWSLITPNSTDGLIDYFAESGSPPSSWQGWYDTTVGVDPTNPNAAVFGGVDMVATKDGGKTFTTISAPYANPGGPTHPDFHAVAFTGAANSFYAGNDGGVYFSKDLGGTGTASDWSNLNATFDTIQFYAGASVDLGHMIGGSQDNGTPGLVPAPNQPAAPAWSELLDGDGTYTAMDPNSTTFYTAQTSLDIYRGDYSKPICFSDACNAKNPTEVAPCMTQGTDPACNDPTDFIAPFVMDRTNVQRLYAGTNRVWMTTNGGGSNGGSTSSGNWKAISGDCRTGGQICLTTGTTYDSGGDYIHAMSIGAGSTAGTVVTASWYGKVFETTNAPAATPTSGWTDITGNLPAYDVNNHTHYAWLTAVVVNPLDSNEVWVSIGVLSGGRVYHTTNAAGGGTPCGPGTGVVWCDITSGTAGASPVPDSLVPVSLAVDPVQPQNLYLGTETGVLVCAACGGGQPLSVSWAPLGSGLPNVGVYGLTLTADAAHIVAWTHGRGAWSMPVPVTRPAAHVSPSSLDFGNQKVKTSSQPKNVTISNDGTAPLNVSSVTVTSGSADYSVPAINPCPVVAQGGSCVVPVTFTPSSSGARSGTLTITDNDKGIDGSQQAVGLNGTGTLPEASLTPTSWDYGSMLIGSTSAKGFTLSNTGQASLSISGVSSSDPTQFPVTSNTCGSSLNAGASCTITVTFTPQNAGNQTATLTVTDDSNEVQNTTQKATLTGTGEKPIPHGTVKPASLDFGNQPVGTTGGPQSVTLTDDGTAPLVISGKSTSGPFGETDNCPATLAVNASCAFQVTFTPTAATTQTGSLIVQDNSGGTAGSQSVPLSGSGTSAAVSFSPNPVTFGGTVAIGSSASQPVTLANTGNGTLNISSISAGGDFSQTNTCGSSLPAGNTCTITVTFTPSTAGPRSGTLSVDDNASGSPQTVQLSGTAVLQFYFAEGYTGPGFQETLDLFMPNHGGTATVDYYLPGGHVQKTYGLAAGQVLPVSANSDVGTYQQVSAVVTLPWMGVVERQIHFTSGAWHGTTDKVGATRAATEWDFAEGSTLSIFSEYLTLENPNSQPASTTIQYFTDSGGAIAKTLTLPPNSRTTVVVFEDSPVSQSCTISGGVAAGCGVGRGFQGVSARVTASLPIIAERPFYVDGYSFGSGVIRDGHVAFGANGPAMQWNFAEGTTVAGFNEYLSLQNPGAAASTVDLTYYTDIGGAPASVKTVTLPPHSRTTVVVFQGSPGINSCPISGGVAVNCGIGPSITGVSVSVSVHAGDPPIVAERPMYMVHDFGFGTVAGADDVVGATTLAQTFGFSAASTTSGNSDFLTIENPNASTAFLTITYDTGSSTVTRSSIAVGAHARHTILISDATTGEGLGPGDATVGIVITASQPVEVEKPTYGANPGAYGATDSLAYSPSSF